MAYTSNLSYVRRMQLDTDRGQKSTDPVQRIKKKGLWGMDEVVEYLPS
jgi:hypothetical protein